MYPTSNEEVDIIVNGKNIQCKSSKHKVYNMFSINTCHLFNGKKIPYTENTLNDFFIFGILNSDDSLNVCYVIPICVMIKLKILSSEKNKGKLGINLPASDYKNDHWAKQFANKFELLNNKNININNFNLNLGIIEMFISKCENFNIICERYDFSSHNKKCKIGNKILQICSSTNIFKHKYCIFKICKNKIWEMDDENIPDFFIF